MYKRRGLWSQNQGRPNLAKSCKWLATDSTFTQVAVLPWHYVVVLPDPFRGWGHGGILRRPNSWATTQGLGQRFHAPRSGQVVPKMVRQRDDNPEGGELYPAPTSHRLIVVVQFPLLFRVVDQNGEATFSGHSQSSGIWQYVAEMDIA